MRVRIKFSKHGVVKFIGHLDIMRYFQKAIRRAGIDVSYTTGFSPHQVMSFAAPLGVGHYSNGEYLDIEVNSHDGRQDMIDRLNGAMVPGIVIKNIVALGDSAGNAIYWANDNGFNMKKAVISDELTLNNKARFIPITITSGSTVVNDGIGIVPS